MTRSSSRDRTSAHERLPDGPPAPECTQTAARWSATTSLYAIDVAVIPASRADFVDWDVDGTGRWRSLGDPTFDQLLAERLTSLTAAVRDGGASQIILFTPARPSPRLPPAERQMKADQAVVYRGLLDQVALAATGPARIQIVDLYTWSTGFDDRTYLRLFPDGVHPSQAGAERIWAELLGPAIPPRTAFPTPPAALESSRQPAGR